MLTAALALAAALAAPSAVADPPPAAGVPAAGRPARAAPDAPKAGAPSAPAVPAATVPRQKAAPPKSPQLSDEDRAVVENLDLLLLLDLLVNYDLFDEAGELDPTPGPGDTPDGGATFRVPAGSKGYRP